jgi:hypothetical protein
MCLRLLLFCRAYCQVSFWTLMRRAQLLGHVLLGYYVLPAAAADPIEAVLCPLGEMRAERRVWNKGDNRLKFIVLQVRHAMLAMLSCSQPVLFGCNLLF